MAPLACELVSFGHKYGMPEQADMVLDMRLLPNPYWTPELRAFPGIVPEVAAYVLDNREAAGLFAVMLPYLEYVLQAEQARGKERFKIAIGCTGGKHRSVAVAEALSRRLAHLPKIHMTVSHRDILRE